MENYMITLQKIDSINWVDNSSKTQHTCIACAKSIHINVSIIIAKLTKINHTFTTLTYIQMH